MKKKKKPIKDEKVLQKLYTKLMQRKAYLNKHHPNKCGKGNLLEVDLLEKYLVNYITPITENGSLKIGDKFTIKNDLDKTVYIVSSFPYELEVTGFVEEYHLNKPLVVTLYYKDAIKVEPPKKVKKKSKKKKKKSKKK